MARTKTDHRKPSKKKITVSAGEPMAGTRWNDSDVTIGEGHDLARKVLDSVRESMLVLDSNLRVVSANEAFYKTFQVCPEETVGRLIYDLGNSQWNIPKLRKWLEQVLTKGKSFSDFEIERRFEKIGRRVMLVGGCQVDHIPLVLLTIDDITEYRMIEQRCSFLLGLSDGFRRADTPKQILKLGARRLCKFMPCQHTFFLEVDAPQNQVRIVGRYPAKALRVEQLQPFIDVTPTFLAALMRGDDIAIEDVRKDRRITNPEHRDFYNRLGIRSLALTARPRDNGLIGLMVVGLAEAHHWQPLELKLLRTVADRTWMAFDAALVAAQIEQLNHSLEELVARRTEMLRLLQDVTRSANEAQNVEESLKAALERVASYSGWPVGHVWKLADDGSGQMVSSGIWYIADNAKITRPRLQKFRQNCSLHRYSQGEGLIGAVKASGGPIWADELSDFDGWQRADAAALGLHAAIAFPITVNGEVTAVMEFFSNQVTQFDRRLMEITPDIGIQLGHVVERKRFEKEIADATEAEQRRIGIDIHDGVGQELTGLRYMAQTHAESLARQSSPDTQTAQRMTESLERVQQQILAIIRKLVPVDVDTKGLVAALRGLACQVTQAHELTCEFECNEPIFLTDAALGTHLYRIVQEAVRNAIKHAHANRIVIRLTEEGGKLILLVADDGIGITETESLPGIGLRSMKHRAGLIGANLDIRAGEKVGTQVSCTVFGDTQSHDNR
jgi:signal transduction histidine kinase